MPSHKGSWPVLDSLMQKAADKLESAKILLEKERFDDAISRAYYTVFHAIQALLQTEGLNATSHQGLKTLFTMNFVKTEKINSKFSKYLRNLKEDREEGDYEAYSTLTREDAETAVREAEEFLDAIKSYLAKFKKN